jgi:hypothetical protein
MRLRKILSRAFAVQRCATDSPAKWTTAFTFSRIPGSIAPRRDTLRTS